MVRRGDPIDPDLPADLDLSRLPEDVRSELRSLSPENAQRVAGHLVAASDLLEEDPPAALAHARAARRTAARLAVVREAVGIAAYGAGEWQEALNELRAVRRMTGDASYLPVLADCERGLGRPERALDAVRSSDARLLDPAGQAELRLVEAGARRDLGEVDAALLVLADAGALEVTQHPWTVRLRYAYADALSAAGRDGEALDWFDRAATLDDEGETDAELRAAALRGGALPG